MAEVVIPVGYGNAVFVMNTSTKVAPVTFTLGYATAGSFIDAVANANGIYDAAVSTAGSLSICAPASMSSAWQLTQVHVYERRSAGPLVRGDSTRGVTVGTISGAGNDMIVSATCRITKRTGFVGRKYRGRMYAPYTRLEADITANGTISSTPYTTVGAAWSKFYANLIALPILPYLLHSDPADAPTAITSFFLQQVVGTQRRRLHQ